MHKLFVTALAILAGAITATAELGETPGQFETGEASKAQVLAGGRHAFMTWNGKNVIHAGVFDMDGHNIGACVTESFLFRDGHDFTQADYNRFLKPYFDKGAYITNIQPQIEGEDFGTIMMHGKAYAVVMYSHKDHMLTVIGIDEFNALRETHETKADPVQGEKNDCFILATENLQRLQKTTVWARIFGFQYSLDGEREPVGHAVVLFKMTKDSPVRVTEARGTWQLDTASTDPVALAAALSRGLSSQSGRKVEILSGGFRE